MRSSDIKAIASEIRSVNGNKTVSKDDMLWYILKRQDEMYVRINQIDDKLDTKMSKSSCSEFRSQFMDEKKQKVTWLIALIALVISLSGIIIPLVR